MEIMDTLNYSWPHHWWELQHSTQINSEWNIICIPSTKRNGMALIQNNNFTSLSANGMLPYDNLWQAIQPSNKNIINV